MGRGEVRKGLGVRGRRGSPVGRMEAGKGGVFRGRGDDWGREELSEVPEEARGQGVLR